MVAPPPALYRIRRDVDDADIPSDAGISRHAALDAVEATALTTGPWRGDAQHGGPPSALLARAVESVLPDGRAIARLSVELVRPVPLGSLTVAAWADRISRRVDHLHARIVADGRIVATATALALATTSVPEPGWRPPVEPSVDPLSLPRSRPAWLTDGASFVYHRDGAELRMEDGTFGDPGSAIAWIRLAVPLVEGEAPSPLSRVMAAADFGSGIGAVYGAGAGIGLINADLTVALHRPLQGEWVRLASETHVGPDGVGLGRSDIGDETGPVGRATQSLLAIRLG